MEKEQYIQLVEKYYGKDYREVNFQNRIIIPLLESIFKDHGDIDIVDVSTQFKNKETDYHTRQHYAGKYTPDVLIVKDWNYQNLNVKNENYLCVIEVKSPRLDPINKVNLHTKSEIESYLSNGNKVILTDCFEWHFYGFDEDVIKIVLHDEHGWLLDSRFKDALLKWDALLEQIHSVCDSK